jgi:anti-sigma regulatory factor (Ser/Thr protein kinase)
MILSDVPRISASMVIMVDMVIMIITLFMVSVKPNDRLSQFGLCPAPSLAWAMKSNFCSPQTGQCRLPTDLRFVAKTLARMNKFFHRRGLAPGAWSELELAAAEALNNAIEHQCSKHMKAEVVCRWNWTAETIQIEIQDAGNYLPASGEAGLPADPLAERGRGALLIERLVDLVEHTVSAEGHSIRLTKRVGAMQ